MKKLICLASLLLAMHTISSQTAIPPVFKVLQANALPEKQDLLLQEKRDCFFHILISTPVGGKSESTQRIAHYKNFTGVDKKQQGLVIPQDFIKPGIPALPTQPTYTLQFGWEDKGGKNNIMEAANAFVKALARIHQNFKKQYNCHYMVVAEGRSGLLLNYATHQLKRETFSLAAAITIGTPLPTIEKGTTLFYPNLTKVGTFYSFYTQHQYLSNASHFPPAPRTSYPQAFVEKHKNLFNIRLLINNNQQSLQNIFERKGIKLSMTYFGQHLFEFCNFIKNSKRSYQEHRDVWVTLDTRTKSKPLIGIISHSAQEKSSKAVRDEHQRAGAQLKEFKTQRGSLDRINMNEGQQTRSIYRPLAHAKKPLQKFACQTA